MSRGGMPARTGGRYRRGRRVALPSLTLTAAIAVAITAAAAAAQDGRAPLPLPPAPVADLLTGNGAVQGIEAPVRAQLRSYRFTTLAAGIPARIDAFDYLEGQRVDKGETIITFDCSSERADRRAAAARADAARAAMRADTELVRRGGAGKVKVDLSRAEYAAASAELEGLDTILDKCSIAAPFAGMVTAKAAQQHQFVNAGEPLLELVDTRAIEVDLVVPSSWLSWLAPGHPFTLQVEETGDRLGGRIDRYGGIVDPVSQTVRVIGRLAELPDSLLPGMSGMLQFADRGERAE